MGTEEPPVPAPPAPGDPALTPNGQGATSASQGTDTTAAATTFAARWGTGGDRTNWSAALLQAVAELGPDLTKGNFLPVDVSTYCPNYAEMREQQRGMFWAALLSSLAKRESDFDPTQQYVESFSDAKGQAVVSRGLLQISQESANGYGCGISNAMQLQDPVVNLRCGVRILDRLVTGSHAIAIKTNGIWRGAAAYWHPFRITSDRDDIARWTRLQPYCTTT